VKASRKLKITAPSNEAAGTKALSVAIRYITKRMRFGKAMHVLNKLNQKHGIDCPGCAWPDPDKRSKLGEYCENGVKAIAEEAMDSKVDPDFFKKHSINDLLNKSDYWLGQQGRLVHPMVVNKGDTHYRPIDWNDAFNLLGSGLKSLDNPNKAIFYTSGRTSNEAAFLYQLFVRAYGTNNLPDCSNMCHESSGVALNETIGIGKGTVGLNDFPNADLILIFGQNPATNHPRMLSSLEKAKENGAKIVTINPLKEAGLLRFKNPQTVHGLVGGGTKITDLYLQIKINEDVALLKAVLIKLLEIAKENPNILDKDFIASHTSGFDKMTESLAGYNFTELVGRTGLGINDVNMLVEWIAGRKKIIICWAMGLTQHKNAVDNIREIVNLLLVKGSIGKPGAGVCPVRGHSNVQGDRTMGITERPSKNLLDKISSNFGFKPPTTHGYSVIEAIKAMYEKKADVFIGLGGNFLPAAPDTNYTATALRNCAITTHISTKLNRSHLVHGKTGLILPCLGRSDKELRNGKVHFVTVENSMGVVHTTQGALDPPSTDLMSEPAIIAGIANATVKAEKIDWSYLVEDYSRIRDLIEKTIDGFDDFNEKLVVSNEFSLPNGAGVRLFYTSDNKARFTVNEIADHKLDDDEFLMMTIRSHDQFNTTIYGLDDRYRGIYNGRNVVFINPDDAKKLDLKKGDVVDLYNNYDDVERKINGLVIVPYNIPSKCIATYYPETNVLIPIDVFAHSSLTPASKSIKVKINKSS
jgi:molybdopterin-dependent oxidoreductase alpha subunit